jgi:hypothetical protein
MFVADRVLHIIYRHVHQDVDVNIRDPRKLRPDWFSWEACFRNLLLTIRSDPLAYRVKILIIYDGTPESFYADFIAGYHANKDLGLDLQFVKGGSNAASFLIALDLLRKSDIPGSDLIYLMENDYLHQPGWVSKLFELYDSHHKLDFVSLYDHRDKYDYDMYANLVAKLVYTQTHHWRTAPSTCGTFILDKAALLQDYDLWTSNISDYYLFSKLVEERKRILLTPIPGLATHCMAQYLSPTIDWEKLSLEATHGTSNNE